MVYANRFLAKIALAAAERMGYTLQKIVALRTIHALELNKKWSDETYGVLVALSDYAESKGHCFEQLQILLELGQYLLENHRDESCFGIVLNRLYALDNVFSLCDDEFGARFEKNYLNTENIIIIKQTEECLVKWFEAFNEHADFMSAHLYNDIAVLCGKAALKIAYLTDKIPFEKVVETCFLMAVNYGHIRDYDSAMRYYDMAIEKAQAKGDSAYEYIALHRKLSIALISSHIDTSINFDKERSMTMQGLLDLADKMETNIHHLGERLLEIEKSNKGEMAEYRRDRLMEAIPVMPLMLALSRGDVETAKKHIGLLKESEQKAYGSVVGYSNAEAMLQLYMMAFDSPDRQESVETEEHTEDTDTEDEEHYIDFPEGMFVSDQFNTLLRYIRNETLLHHYDGVGSLGLQALEIAKSVYSVYHAAMATHSMAQRLEHLGDAEGAISMYESVIDLLESSDETRTNSRLSPYLYYATLFEIGNLQKANFPDSAVEKLTAALSYKDVPNMFQTNILLARAEAYANKQVWEQRDQDCIKVLNLTLDEAKARVPYIDRETREKLWQRVQENIERVARLADAHSGRELIVALYNAVLCAKGFLVSSEHSIKQAVYSEPKLSDYIPLYEKVQAYNDNKQKWGTSTEDSSEEYVEHYADEMRLLLGTSEVIGKYFDFLNVSYQDIQKAMPDASVVVDYFDYDNGEGDREYMAFVFRKGDESPKIITLCKESELQKVYDEMADSFGDATHASMIYSSQLPFGFEIKDLLWTKVQKKFQIKETEDVYFVPSGSIHKIALESLPAEALFCGGTLADAFYGFYRLSNARQIMAADDVELKDVTLFGGLEYGNNEGLESTDRGYAVYDRKSTPTELHPWGKLPMTAQEVNQITFLCNSWKEGSTRKLTGENGTNEEFFSLSHKAPSILHIATHGFFETHMTARNLPALRNKFRPMDLSGLVLSNGNHGWLDDGENHEGIITASDISRMDLSDTQLVVLSACYTGEGVVRSDGVFGLQRGFKKAGAKSIIMSLWNESDEVGCRFMCEFYARLLTNGNNIRQAFNDAKRELHERYENPLFCAGFILID